MMRHQLNHKLECSTAQLFERSCASAQDSQVSASTFNHPAASRHNQSAGHQAQCTSSQVEQSQSQRMAAQQRGSAFDACAPDGGHPARTCNGSGASGNSLGVVGQAMIVTSRIDGYCRAVWELLLQCADEHDEGACLDTPDATASVAPLAMFLAAVRMLVQHLILLRVQALHISAVANEADARALLQHVLLWQYLRHHTVIELITLALQQGAGSPPATGRGTNAAHGSFLMSVGVPLVQQAIAQVHGSLTMHTSSDSSGGALDMLAVMRMLHKCSTQAPAQSADCDVDALSRDAASLHRAVAFISANTAVVAKLLSTAQCGKSSSSSVDPTLQSSDIFAALAYTSALLGNTAHASIRYSEMPAVAIARESVAKYSSNAARLYRSAKAKILDARINTTCVSSTSTAEARSKIGVAVSKAFRQMYLFPELKHLLQVWGPMLEDVVNDGLLPVEGVVGADYAAKSAFDTEGQCLRFKVPSSGFLLIWSTCPHSPAHSLESPDTSPLSRGCAPQATNSRSGAVRSGGIGLGLGLASQRGATPSPSTIGLKRGPSGMLQGSARQPAPRRSASAGVFIEFGQPPQPCPLQTLHLLNTSGDTGSNGSDSTNVGGGSGPNSDSGGSDRLAPLATPKGNSEFAVPSPRPVRHHPKPQVSPGLFAEVQQFVQGARAAPQHASAAALPTTSAPAAPLPPQRDAFPGDLAALAVAASRSR